MKNFKRFLLALVAGLAGVASAQDYYSPSDKEKEPIARFPLQNIVTGVNADGKRTIRYTLPAELTGVANEINAVETTPAGSNPLVRIYAGSKATITCMGADVTPGCMVTHRNLEFDKIKAAGAIDKSFYDPQFRSSALEVVEEFEHSGNQPIGVLSNLKPRAASSTQLPQGTMKTQYDTDSTVNGKTVRSLVQSTIDWNNKTFTIEGSGITGTLTGVERISNRVHGRWNASGSSGWFEFVFNNDLNRFEGYYGAGNNGSLRAGRWVSRNLCNLANCSQKQ